MNRYVCIHGHFYQPPRENPWLEAVERQESAAPAHDWNERVTIECYRPNARARRLGEDGWLDAITNNYARISYNFGPTLLSWLEEHEPGVYDAILDADRISVRRFSGHGSAIAQAFNHLIMPLTNERDKKTQVIWGIEDFKHRFGRHPEGMWLPETACDTASLEALAEHGIRYTILAPRQCKSIRKLGDTGWQDVGEGVDPSRAYVVNLPSGRTINVFFYDGPVSQAVAFEQLLESGERFANRLMSGLSDDRGHTQLVHIGTDGETYGHHHRYGEMALAYTIEKIERSGVAKLTNYAEFLDIAPPEFEAEIHENSSWSCVHGVERWRSDCGCHSGGNAGWNQAWRAPLRKALDWLRDELAPRFEAAAAELLQDPWEARDAYVHLVLDRSSQVVDGFFRAHGARSLDRAERVRALQLLEMQRHAMYMYTSCGWFFDELSGIETVQVMRYAGRAIQLAEETLGIDLLDPFLERLGETHSNLPQLGSGRRVFDLLVRPSFVSLLDVGAHYGVDLLFEDLPAKCQVYCYDTERLALRREEAGQTALRVGQVRLTSRMTRETGVFSFASVHLGDHVVHAGVRPFRDDESFEKIAQDLADSFEHGDVAELIRTMDREFGKSTYSLRSLFREEQQRVISHVMRSKIDDVQDSIRRAYDNAAPLMRFVHSIGAEMPGPLAGAAFQVLNAELETCLNASELDHERLADLLDEAVRTGAALDIERIRDTLHRALRRLGRELRLDGARIDKLSKALELIPVLEEFPFEIDLSELQIAACTLRDEARAGLSVAAMGGDDAAEMWTVLFEKLADELKVRLDTRRSEAIADA
ncbi:MAG: DUF3536 domain-containing protein [Planctomycetota bacterium]